MAAEEIQGFRLSPQQEHLWILQEASGGASWGTLCTVDIRGLLDPERLRRSLLQLVGRYEILRTTFRRFPGMGTLPLQVVETTVHDRLSLHCGSADPEALALKLAAQAPDTATGPGLQADLIEVGPRRYLLLLRLPALCADRIGIESLAAEVARTYAGELPDAEPAQYADVAEVLAQILEADKVGTGREYWNQQVFPQPVAPELPWARPRVPGGSRVERNTHAALEGRLAASVASFAFGLRAAPTSVLLAAWQVVLGRLGGSSDFLLGVTFPGRTEEELEETPGLFARYLPLRSRPAGNRRFEDLVAAVEEEASTAASWQDYFSWRCFGESPGHPASPDLLPFGFDFLNAPATASANGVMFAPRPSRVVLEPFVAELVVRWDDRRPDLELLYDGARLDPAEAHVLFEAVLAVLETTVIHPGLSLGEIPLIREAQRHRLVAEWNDTRANLPGAGETLAGLFAKQATRTPERRAVELEGRGWTYGDLAARTGRLATRLRRSGVGPEIRVGVLAERSPELICGLLAVAATGGSYVPLDPDLPPERLARIAQDAQPRLLLTDREPEPWLAALGIPALILDDLAGDSEPEGDPLWIAAEPDHVAYILYTSGSTGSPKGVMISHRAIVNRLLWMQRDYPLVASDRVAQKTPIGFDASVWEIFLPLATGACVVLARPGGHRDGSHLAHLVAQRGVTVLQLVPSVLRAWLDEPGLEESCRRRLRMLFCGGEALSADLSARARERLGLAPHNLYGPTECAIDAASRPAGLEDVAETASVPIGRPIANVRIHLLDSSLQAVPAGALGELYVGGAGLARGYLGRPDLTAEKFLPDPFAGTTGEAGGRVYHTGDLARQRPDGTLEFLGRIDHQVKVNGVRVELGEIEAMLLSHPAVGEAAVVSRQSPAGGGRLAAYVAPATGCPSSDGQLHQLPGGLSVVCWDRRDAEEIHREIFEEEIYLRGGVTLGDEACVVDAGANIGLFTLFVHATCRNPRVLAFEPVPPLFDKLRANLELYGLAAEIHHCALAEAPGPGEVTFYPRRPGMSGLHADLREDEAIARAALAGRSPELLPHADEILEGSFAMERFPCRLSTLSAALRESGVGRVDLLKIDAEKSELRILSGIEPEDWPKIRQVALEAHDRDGTVEALSSLLAAQGFHLEVERSHSAACPGLCFLYATRPGNAAAVASGGRLELRSVSASSLRHWLGQRLPAAMVPADWIVLPRLPRLPSGKLDRQALPAADSSSREARGPRTPTEEILAGVWREVLGVESSGVQDDFFQAGGHSLLGIRLVSRVGELFGIPLRVRALFESPTLELLAEEIERLRGLRTAAPPPSIGLADRRGELPLSFSQQRIWFLEQFENGAATHNLPLGTRLEGHLDAGALSASIQGVVSRHEALRTRFVVVEGRPIQRVWPALEVALPRIDLTALPAAIREPEAVRLAGDEARRRFDLAAEPLLRVRLIRLERQHHVLFATLSHMVGDGWSTGILVRELGTLYTARVQGEASPLPELPIQYADFSCWQRQWLQGDILAEQLGYWRRRLEGAPQTLDLPADRSRPPLWTGRGARRPFALSPRISDDLVSLSRSRGVSLFMTLLAGLSALFHRYTGRRDFLIGSPVANRNRREVEPLIGLFANLLVLRLEPEGEQSFAELLAQIREEALSAFAHQDLPFERLVEELRPERDPSRPPLAQVVLVLQNTPWEPLELPGLRLSPFPFESGTTKFDLTLDLRETPRGITGALEHSTDLFDASTIARLASHLAVLLSGAVAAPNRPLVGLPLLTETERQQLAFEWNDGRPVEPGTLGLHRAFEAWAARTPDAIAVRHEDLRISYGALNRRANRAARALQKEGCKPGDRVGLFVDRSPELVLGILAILKAGGTYVPLDPAYPRERLELLCEGATLRRVVATPDLAASFPAVGVRIVLLPEGPDGLADSQGDNLSEGDLPDSIAYVIHTSGSTGRPKGVMVSHASVLRLFAATSPWFGFGPDDVWTLFHSFAFDFSVWEIWGALLHGGSLVIVPHAVSRSPEAFLELLISQRVTVLNQTPSALQQLIRTEAEKGAASENSLRWILLGGEALSPASLAPWFARHGYERPQVANLYGITETTVHTTFHQLQPADLQPSPPGAIGRPIPDLRVYVADDSLALLPAGIPGELCVAGPGLSLGYLDLPDRTAERFVPDPWSGAPGGRLYRSGDLARRRPDGVLEFLGRLDHQLKVRGFRIEPGEIEAVLTRHPAVTSAAVTAQRDGSGALRLVAYFVAADSAGPRAEELRKLLRTSLPEPLVPSVFLRLETLPLTPNGKIDRRALPALGTGRPELERGFLEPRNALERVLAGIWSEVLGIEAVGVEDDFFDLGGHSLLATQVVSRIRQIFRVALPLRILFGATTIARLAEALAAEDPRPGHSERVAQAVLRLSAMSEEDILRLRERRAASDPPPAGE